MYDDENALLLQYEAQKQLAQKALADKILSPAQFMDKLVDLWKEVTEIGAFN